MTQPRKTSDENCAAFMKTVASTMRDAIKLKSVMLKKNLTEARAKCPECEGELHGGLAGPKKHMRFWCDGPCKRQMME
jgi:uncharacterized protein with PIN domain